MTSPLWNPLVNVQKASFSTHDHSPILNPHLSNHQHPRPSPSPPASSSSPTASSTTSSPMHPPNAPPPLNPPAPFYHATRCHSTVPLAFIFALVARTARF